MLGVQNQAGVEHLTDYRIGPALREHVEKILAELEVIAGRYILVTTANAGKRRHDRRQFGDQPHGGPVIILGVLNSAPRIEHPEGGHGSLQGVHGMSLFRQGFDHVHDLKLDPPVQGDIARELHELQARGQAIEEQQIGCFQKRALRCQFLNPYAAILQHAGLAVDIADLGSGGRYSGKSRHKVVRHGVGLLWHI